MYQLCTQVCILSMKIKLVSDLCCGAAGIGVSVIAWTWGERGLGANSYRQMDWQPTPVGTNKNWALVSDLQTWECLAVKMWFLFCLLSHGHRDTDLCHRVGLWKWHHCRQPWPWQSVWNHHALLYSQTMTMYILLSLLVLLTPSQADDQPGEPTTQTNK